MPRPHGREKHSKLRALAASTGYTVERAPIRDAWFLTDERGKLAVSDRGATAFNTARAIAFLTAVSKRASK